MLSEFSEKDLGDDKIPFNSAMRCMREATMYEEFAVAAELANEIAEKHGGPNIHVCEDNWRFIQFALRKMHEVFGSEQ